MHHSLDKNTSRCLSDECTNARIFVKKPAVRLENVVFFGNVNKKYNKSSDEKKQDISKYQKGISAEDCAEKEMILKGYEILGRRVRTKYGEIDILAKKGNDVVAVEVKLRKSLDLARESIQTFQKQRISNAFLHIISVREKPFETYRIDVIFLDRVGRIEHIENAFYIDDYSCND